jgi:hypothetical protein
MGERARRAACAAAALAALVASRAARANDSEAVLAGGTLTLKKSDGITMESEELTIAPFKVNVAYRFRNTTAADITTRVAFPMAPYTLWDDGETPAERRKLLGEMGAFSVVVDGKPVKFETETATATGKQKGADTVTVTHHWQQTFPAGRAVSVRHTFTPRGAFIWSFEHDGAELEARLANDYCVGPVLMRAMKKKGEGGIVQVHYVLKTGANWKGPIGRFVLRLEKEKPSQKVSVCMDGFRKVDERTFELEKTSFVPTRDLMVAFISL